MKVKRAAVWKTTLHLGTHSSGGIATWSDVLGCEERGSSDVRGSGWRADNVPASPEFLAACSCPLHSLHFLTEALELAAGEVALRELMDEQNWLSDMR